MAQIFAFGRVENDLAPKKSQKDSTYVCFGFTEQTGKGQFQYYQVWAWAAGRLYRGTWKGTDKNPEGLSFQFRISSGPHPQRKLH